MKAVAARARVQVKNVLFATDFSPAAAGAVPYAREIAKRYGANLFALHVRPPVVNPMTAPASWAAEVELADAQQKQQRETLIAAFPGTKPEVIIEEGDIQSSVTHAIDKHEIDLIVIGTRGRTGVGKFFLGSTAEEILRHSPCPVLTVGPHSLSGPAVDGRLREILYATDLSVEAPAAAAYALSLAQEFQARLTLLHVISDRKAGELAIPEQFEESSTELLRKLVPPEAEAWCKPQFVVGRGEAAEKILKVAEDRNADLIVLGVRAETGFPGAATHLPIATAHKVVSHATCPVLTVRGQL
jgi:nucleotide-binding universal stress UspA family protein